MDVCITIFYFGNIGFLRSNFVSQLLLCKTRLLTFSLQNLSYVESNSINFEALTFRLASFTIFDIEQFAKVFCSQNSLLFFLVHNFFYFLCYKYQ